MSVINNNLLLTSGDAEGYQISRSVRLRSSASAYLNRTSVASPTNNKIFTISQWVKRGIINDPSVFENLLGGASSQQDTYGFGSGTNNAGDSIQLRDANVGSYNLLTTQVFRDPSSWYHLVLSIDTTQATASNRVKLYVNGVQVTSFSTATYPAQNYVFEWNAASTASVIARRSSGNSSWYFDGYLTEVNFIDGQALTPSDFGETDTTTGVWKPKRYAGTYGTNGFYLNFSDNSAATAAAIGKDSSGNGNNWTPNNISVTSGVTYDSMLDVPTMYADGGNGRGNYAVLNPLSKGSTATVSDGNLKTTSSGRSSGSTLATIAMGSGMSPIYWETAPSINVTNSDPLMAGIVPVDSSVSVDSRTTGFMTYCYSGGIAVTYQSTTAIFTISRTLQSTDVMQFAYKPSTNEIWLGINNTWYDSAGGTTGNPSTGANPTKVVDSAKTWVANLCVDGPSSLYAIANFGQRPFTYTPPTGFKALNTQNLPDATIKKGNAYFDVLTYSGNSANPRSISGIGFQPDLVWVKQRTSNGGGFTDHQLYDAVRGTQKLLRSNTTNAELSSPSNGGVQSFDTSGFTVQGSSASINMNATGETYVGWQWKAGGSAVSNTDGSITSSVSANASAGFSVVTWTEPTSGSVTVGHGLGVAPKMVIAKARTLSTNWSVWHTAFTSSQYILLNSTAAVATSTNRWNNTLPTSTVFSAGSDFSDPSSPTMVAYCFAEVAGYSKFGSYTGNGSADGPFVYCGFRPKFVLMKDVTSGSYDWQILDSVRNSYNAETKLLSPNSSSAEFDNGTAWMDFTANGFKVRYNAAPFNSSGNTYIFAAFAENPFKNSLAR